MAATHGARVAAEMSEAMQFDMEMQAEQISQRLERKLVRVELRQHAELTRAAAQQREAEAAWARAALDRAGQAHQREMQAVLGAVAAKHTVEMEAQARAQAQAIAQLADTLRAGRDSLERQADQHTDQLTSSAEAHRRVLGEVVRVHQNDLREARDRFARLRAAELEALAAQDARFEELQAESRDWPSRHSQRHQELEAELRWARRHEARHLSSFKVTEQALATTLSHKAATLKARAEEAGERAETLVREHADREHAWEARMLQLRHRAAGAERDAKRREARAVANVHSSYKAKLQDLEARRGLAC